MPSMVLCYHTRACAPCRIYGDGKLARETSNSKAVPLANPSLFQLHLHRHLLCLLDLSLVSRFGAPQAPLRLLPQHSLGLLRFFRASRRNLSCWALGFYLFLLWGISHCLSHPGTAPTGSTRLFSSHDHPSGDIAGAMRGPHFRLSTRAVALLSPTPPTPLRQRPTPLRQRPKMC